MVISLQSCEGIEEEFFAPQDIIQLAVLDLNDDPIMEVIGDGDGIIKLRAQIAPNAEESLRSVTFKSSEGGNFEGISETAATIIADDFGIAETLLRVPLDNGVFFVSAEVTSKDKVVYSAETSITLVSVDDVIQMSFKNIDGSSLDPLPRADGTTVFQIAGNVLVNQDQLSSIKFSATGGTFIETGNTEITRTSDQDGVAIVEYKVPQSIGPVFYTVSTGENNKYDDTDSLVFERAHAEEIFIEPTTLTMNTMTSNVINAFLIRSFGKVSLETPVVYTAFQIIEGEEIEVGRFTGLSTAVTDANGKATATFIADTGNIDFTLPVTIRVSTQTDSGDVIIDEIPIQVIE